MQILKAYAQAEATGRQNWETTPQKTQPRERQQPREKQQPKDEGDKISLSEEAREMLNYGGDALSTCPQDATYDQYGHVTRQFDSLQGDLRTLAAQVMGTSEGAAVAGRLNSLRWQVAGIKAMV